MIDEITYLRRMIYTYKNPGSDKDLPRQKNT